MNYIKKNKIKWKPIYYSKFYKIVCEYICMLKAQVV